MHDETEQQRKAGSCLLNSCNSCFVGYLHVGAGGKVGQVAKVGGEIEGEEGQAHGLLAGARLLSSVSEGGWGRQERRGLLEDQVVK